MAGEERRKALGTNADRQMPSNIEAEQAVLGTILMHNESLSRCADILSKESFFEPLHQAMYEVIAGLVPAGKTANPITMRTYLPEQDLGGMTVQQYLALLAREAGLPQNVREYASILNDLAVRRQMISIALDTLELAYDAPVSTSAKQIAEGFMDQVATLKVDPGEVSDFEDWDTAADRAMAAVEDIYRRGGQPLGMSTGLARLDDAIGGLKNGNLIILAGRPAMGKTSLAMNVSLAVAKALQARRDAGERTGVVGFASLEMSTEELTQRMIADQANVSLWRIQKGQANETDLERMAHAKIDLRRLPLAIDKTGQLTIGQIAMRARALKKRRGLELLVIDYLQLLKGSSHKNDNRVQEVTEITTGLKALAKELDIPIIALSQLSRKVEERDDKRPMLSDLRESGSIEQDADCVLFVFREEYYLTKQKVPLENTEARMAYDVSLARAKGVAEVIVGKNRHGPEMTVELGFKGYLTRFENEPEEREVPDLAAMKEAKKGKPESLPQDSFLLLSILRSLMLAADAPSADLRREDKRITKDGRVIPVDRARKQFAISVLGDESDEGKIKTKFTNAMKPLTKSGAAFWTGNEELGYWVWLPGMV